MARKKIDLNLDLTLILTMDLNFAVGQKGIALLDVAVIVRKIRKQNLAGGASPPQYYHFGIVLCRF